MANFFNWAFISGVLNFGKFPSPQCWVASKPTFLCLRGKDFKLLITLTIKKAQVIVFHHLMNLCSFSKTPAYRSNIIYNCYKPQKTLKRAFWYISVPPCIWQYYSIILISVSYPKSLFFSLGLLLIANSNKCHPITNTEQIQCKSSLVQCNKLQDSCMNKL